MEANEDQQVEKKPRGARKVRPAAEDVNGADPKTYLGWASTIRFLAEVHRLEQEGHVQSRSKLEEDLHMYPTAITRLRAGVGIISVADIQLLAGKYGADVLYIVSGQKHRDTGIPTRLMRPRYDGYTFQYRKEPHPALVKIAEQLDRERGAAILGKVREVAD